MSARRYVWIALAMAAAVVFVLAVVYAADRIEEHQEFTETAREHCESQIRPGVDADEECADLNPDG